MEQRRESWVAKVRALPRKVVTGAIAQVKKRYKPRNRYGPRYANAMLIAAFLAFFLPIPGSVLASIALIVVIAEVHRAISRSGGFRKAIADLVVVVKANMPGWAMRRWPSPSG